MEYDKQQLEIWHFEDDLTYKQIGEKLNLSHSAINRAFKKLGIKHRWFKYDEQQLRKWYFEEDLSMAQIGEKLNRSTVAIGGAFKRLGIKAKDPLIQIGKKELEILYCEKRLPLQEIAEHFCCSPVVISRRLKKFGLSRTIYIDIDPDEIKRLYHDEGMEQHEIANLFGCHQLTISNRMREYGIKAREGGFRKNDPKNVIDLTGQIFGRLTVLHRGKDSFFSASSENGRKKVRVYWTCLCECGEIKDIPSTSLKEKRENRKTVSCGCWNKEKSRGENNPAFVDLTGKRFFDKVVIKRVPDKEEDGKIIIRWYVKYDSGDEDIFSSNQLWRKENLRINRMVPSFRLNNSMSLGIWDALNGCKNNRHWEDLVPYTLEDLNAHIEKQFDEKMTWDNYGSYWHLDHIVPKTRFNFESSDDREFKLCWSLENLQPLEAIENIKKKDKIYFSEQEELLSKWGMNEEMS